MSDMTERVTKAIAAADGYHSFDEDASPQTIEYYRNFALAAIKATREHLRECAINAGPSYQDYAAAIEEIDEMIERGKNCPYRNPDCPTCNPKTSGLTPPETSS